MHIVIVGDGKVGSTVAAQLSTEGHDIIIIDSNATALENAGNTMDIICVEGNGCSAALQKEAGVPEADLLYLPGGYPEFHLKALFENGVMRSAIRDYARSGGRLLAECGGMMYLCRHITGMDGRDYPMADVLPLDATMEGMRLHLGYRRVALGNTVYRGHEFHYSSVRGEMPSVARLSDAAGNAVGTPMYRYKNTIAGYTHLYWGESDILKLWE